MEKKGRIGAERGKQVWYLVTTGGIIIEKFRTKVQADKTKTYNLKAYGWGLDVMRDTEYRKRFGVKE